ncbi:hypothetical protein ACFX2J_006110 [Malus domestica]|uniref:Uncharacterized protein n=1 Tax=Malus domestica TaxID=3750 RepID=A0A498IR95_MALDO|nr:uncharacterized protein LOC103447484 [Malus domestica]RXH84694.1 hypothetical protein DVH24_032978 [Malus domestica]
MMDFVCSKPDAKVWDICEAAANYNYKGFIRPSDLSSPSSSSALEDSELVSSDQSTETTTDEDDDYIAELTRQMTHYMLQDDHEKINTTSSQKNQEFLGSVGSQQYSVWSPLGSSHGSSEGSSLEPTPPETPGKGKARKSCTYADVLRKLDKLDTRTTNEGLNHPRRIDPSTKVDPGVGFFSKQDLSCGQSQDFQKLEAYYKVNQEHISNKQGSSANGGRQAKICHEQFEPNNYQHLKKGGSCIGSTNGGRSKSPTQFGLPGSNPWLNQQAGPGMRAVFLGGSCSKIGSSSGTGVFLPCVIGSTSQSPKKRGCPPVLIPAKVVQALKVHFDRVGDLPRPNASGTSTQNDALKGGRANAHSTNKRHSRTVPDMNTKEIGLPQEWTY